MSAATGLSESTIGRIWREHGLKPHRVRSFKLSTDPRFVEKLRDIVGLYLNPPEHAIVLSCDEKSQIQALDRTQPGLPMKKGRCGTMTHDYKRNGTTSLFAALNVADGTVISECYSRHRHQEWLKFLNLIKSNVPGDVEVHVICDNYATHKHEKVQKWAKRNPRCWRLSKSDEKWRSSPLRVAAKERRVSGIGARTQPDLRGTASSCQTPSMWPAIHGRCATRPSSRRRSRLRSSSRRGMLSVSAIVSRR